jgi:hypothetical protein
MITSRFKFYAMILRMAVIGLSYLRAMRPVVEKITKWLMRER